MPRLHAFRESRHRRSGMPRPRQAAAFPAAVLLLGAVAAAFATAGPPEVLDARYVIEAVTSPTDVVTPVGCTFDHRGRLLVIESHTHQRPEGYAGPPHDRIRLAEDTDGDGRPDRFRTFHEGTRFTMGIRLGPGGWIYVATRAEVFRIRDTDGDDVADQREQLLRLETAGDYPHNGLGGLAFAGDGSLVVGLGENLGAAYTLVAADGSSWAGEGEGGSVFRCSATGTDLVRVATGFWNPFGLAFDPVGRLFAVDNDPDARPPCRLIDVVATGDYGYRFRYGRSGRHPLQCWDGELPGTLPMAAGTGEAPCNVVPYDGGLWVTSWGHNRLEVFTPAPAGAACRATSRIVVQGDHEFRPVDAAVAPDGSLLVTDWVDRSYPVHGRGRLWRLRVAQGAPRTGAAGWPPLSAGEQQSRRLASPAAAPAERLAALRDDNPFIRQAAVAGLVAADAALVPAWDRIGDGLEKLGVLQLRRWQDDVGRYSRLPEGRPTKTLAAAERDPLLAAALADADDRVVSFAIRWIADERIVELRPGLERLLAADSTPQLVPAVLAALDWLDQSEADPRKPVDREATRRRLQAIWQDAARPARVRLASLQLSTELPRGDALAAVAAIAATADGANEPLAREAVRLLAARPTADVAATLEKIAADAALPAPRRADALAGLAQLPQGEDRLAAFNADADKIVAAASRDLARRDAPAGSPPSDATQQPSRAAATDKSFGPAAADVAAWTARVGAGGDAEAGWRLFFGAKRARCAECHAVGGRGAAIGPELSGIARRMGRSRVLESILQPAREVGPAFQPYAVTLADGRVVNGISVSSNDRDRTERFLTAEGTELSVPMADIEHRTPLATSIMPAGLEQGLSDDDLRNLLALLEQ
jgi:putative membrane-bound dehydrogenase-like protein